MHKKAIIFDLDNTIYPVSSIGDELFAPLFELIASDEDHTENMEQIKDELMRRPFQTVAADFGFSKELQEKGISLLSNLVYKGKIEPFEDFHRIKRLPVDKYLVTTGFKKMQQGKIDGMKLGPHFKRIHIIDPAVSKKTKKDVFEEILRNQGYQPSEILVVGDDPESEIKAAKELGIPAILFDRSDRYPEITAVPRISNFADLEKFLDR